MRETDKVQQYYTKVFLAKDSKTRKVNRWKRSTLEEISTTGILEIWRQIR